MTRIMLVAMLAAFGTVSAQAAITTNAITTNAITTNSLTCNAITTNSLTMNAITTNAITTNGSEIGAAGAARVIAVELPAPAR